MALVATQLAAAGFSSDATSYAFTLSSQPADNTLILASYFSGVGAGTASLPTVTGCGLTWVEIASTTIASLRRTSMFRALGTVTSSGPVVFDHGSSSQTRALATVVQWAGADTGGTNGSGAVVQSTCATNTSTQPTVPLNTFADAVNNVTFMGVGINVSATTNTITPEAGYTGVGPVYTNAPASAIISEYLLGQDTGPTVDTTGSFSWAAVALEVKMSTAGGATFIRVPQLSLLGVG